MFLLIILPNGNKAISLISPQQVWLKFHLHWQSIRLWVLQLLIEIMKWSQCFYQPALLCSNFLPGKLLLFQCFDMSKNKVMNCKVTSKDIGETSTTPCVSCLYRCSSWTASASTRRLVQQVSSSPPHFVSIHAQSYR